MRDVDPWLIGRFSTYTKYILVYIYIYICKGQRSSRTIYPSQAQLLELKGSLPYQNNLYYKKKLGSKKTSHSSGCYQFESTGTRGPWPSQYLLWRAEFMTKRLRGPNVGNVDGTKCFFLTGHAWSSICAWSSTMKWPCVDSWLFGMSVSYHN